MSSRHTTAATICLVLAVSFGFILNCLALFLKQWITTTDQSCVISWLGPDQLPQSFIRRGVGLIPIECVPPYFKACAYMMIVSFVLYVMLVGFFFFGFISFMLKKTKQTRIGYRLVAILSFATAALQIASFIVTLACQQMYVNTVFFLDPIVGACAYLALTSGLLGFCSLGASWFLQRGLGSIDSQ